MIMYADNIVEIIKAIAWPSTIAIFAYLFRVEIKSLVKSLEKFNNIETGSLKFTKSPTITQNSESYQSKNDDTLLKSASSSGSILNTDSNDIKMIIESIGEQLDEIEGEKAKINQLIRELALTRQRLSFEFVYGRIFGSQITALRRINERVNVSQAEAIDFFQVIVSQYPEMYRNFPFESWASFLIRNNLIVEENNYYKITEHGKNFLLYLTIMHLSELKPL